MSIFSPNFKFSCTKPKTFYPRPTVLLYTWVFRLLIDAAVASVFASSVHLILIVKHGPIRRSQEGEKVIMLSSSPVTLSMMDEMTLQSALLCCSETRVMSQRSLAALSLPSKRCHTFAIWASHLVRVGAPQRYT